MLAPEYLNPFLNWYIFKISIFQVSSNVPSQLDLSQNGTFNFSINLLHLVIEYLTVLCH